MATKTKTEQNSSNEELKNEDNALKEELKAELKAEIMEEAKAELREELKAELKAEMESASEDAKPEENSVEQGETEEQRAHSMEKVPYILPIIPGEPEEVNVTINGRTLQILRGEQVEIPRMYAEVLNNQLEQARAFKKFQEDNKEQVTVVD